MADNDKVWLVIIGPEEPEKNDRISLDILKTQFVKNNIP